MWTWPISLSLHQQFYTSQECWGIDTGNIAEMSGTALLETCWCLYIKYFTGTTCSVISTPSSLHCYEAHKNQQPPDRGAVMSPCSIWVFLDLPCVSYTSHYFSWQKITGQALWLCSVLSTGRAASLGNQNKPALSATPATILWLRSKPVTG